MNVEDFLKVNKFCTNTKIKIFIHAFKTRIPWSFSAMVFSLPSNF